MPKLQKLITFEGTEGAGKSTLIQAVARALQGLEPSREIILTREPGGTGLGEKIRALLLHTEMPSWTELFLYEAARNAHVEEVIRPALKRGAWVLCDRFTDSTLAYQGAARGLDWKTLRTLNQLATDGVHPGLSVLLDVDPARGLARAKVLTRFEAEGLEFQKRVRRGFLKAIREDRRRWLHLKIKDQSPETLAELVAREIQTRYFRRKATRK